MAELLLVEKPGEILRFYSMAAIDLYLRRGSQPCDVSREAHSYNAPDNSYCDGAFFAVSAPRKPTWWASSGADVMYGTNTSYEEEAVYESNY